MGLVLCCIGTRTKQHSRSTTAKQADRLADRQTNRGKHRQTDRQRARETLIGKIDMNGRSTTEREERQTDKESD